MSADKHFPYTPVPGNLKRLLEKIPTIGTPPKATQEWLASIGFPGGNNKRSLAVLRQVGVIGPRGEPTDLWAALRSKERAKFAAGVKKHYSELFATYPDAHRKDDEALIAFIRSKTTYAEGAQRLAVRTFKVFTEFGDFDKELPPEELAEQPEDGDDDESGTTTTRRRQRKGATGDNGSVSLTVNIQLQLPPSADGEVYDKLFAAMGKHLKGLVSVE
jgi:hypothetical protein